jgi:hypothetical protein
VNITAHRVAAELGRNVEAQPMASRNVVDLMVPGKRKTFAFARPSKCVDSLTIVCHFPACRKNCQPVKAWPMLLRDLGVLASSECKEL